MKTLAFKTALILFALLFLPAGQGICKKGAAVKSWSGTGFIIHPDGYILTCDHVVRDAKNMKVILENKKEYPAEVIKTNRDKDISLIRIKAKGLAPLKIGDSDKAQMARGTDERTYPWGEGIDPEKANYGANDSNPIGGYPSGASPYDCMDMAGNVAEWVQDWYDAGYYKKSPDKNPQGPETGKYRIIRGGAWREIGGFLRCTIRDNYRVPDCRPEYGLGFRCAK